MNNVRKLRPSISKQARYINDSLLVPNVRRQNNPTSLVILHMYLPNLSIFHRCGSFFAQRNKNKMGKVKVEKSRRMVIRFVECARSDKPEKIQVVYKVMTKNRRLQ